MNEPTDARIGDAERERALRTLSHHVGAGRLSLTEFEARSTIVAAATTSADLARVLLDLPLPVTAALAPVPHPLLRTSVIGVSLAVVAISAVLTTGNWWWITLTAAMPTLAAYRRIR